MSDHQYYNKESLSHMKQRAPRMQQQESYDSYQSQSRSFQSYQNELKGSDMSLDYVQSELKPTKSIFEKVGDTFSNFFFGSSNKEVMYNDEEVQQYNYVGQTYVNNYQPEVKPGYSRHEVQSMEGFHNDSDPKYDLGQDGAFSDFTVLVGNFHYQWINDSAWKNGPGAAFARKGFNIKLIMIDSSSKYDEYIQGLLSEQYDAAWLISCATDPYPEKRFDLENALETFHKQGRGLLIWADNDPYFVHANYALEKLTGCHLVGNDHGDRVLGYGKGFTPGEFDEESVIFAGLNYLYEGITICHPVMRDGSPIADADTKLKTLATSTDGYPCIAYVESTDTNGRIILDTGFTKMYEGGYWESAGQARYVINSAVYLIDVERRFGETHD